jgi:hypothetical protein
MADKAISPLRIVLRKSHMIDGKLIMEYSIMLGIFRK